MEDNQVLKLQEQAAAARYIASRASKRAQSVRDRVNQHAIAHSFDADTGMDVIQMSDGSTRYARTNTNGARGVGDTFLMHQGEGIAHIDFIPTLKRIPAIHKPRQPKPSYAFWMLLDDYLLLINVSGNNAIVKLLTKAASYPPPYNYFHGSEPGLARFSNTEFYIPRYDSIDVYNLSNLTAYSFIGTPDDLNSAITYTYSCCSLPSKYYFFNINDNNDYVEKIYRISPDGSTSIHPYDDPVILAGETAWSIAAINENLLFMVTDYGKLVKLDLSTSACEIIFHVNDSYYNTLPSLYGFTPEGYQVFEVTYVFSDPFEKVIYCVATIVDPAMPDLQLQYVVDLQIQGLAPEVTEFGNVLHIVTGNFPANKIFPGNFLNEGAVFKVINNNTIYAYVHSPWTGIINTTLNTASHYFRTAIFKVNSLGQLELYFKFPSDNEFMLSGYQQFYNLPCRGAVIDFKTKDIYMQGTRNNVIENGLLVGGRDGFNQGTLIKIAGKSKKLSVLNLKFDVSVTNEDQQLIQNEWNFFAQLEPIYKLSS